MSTAVYIARRIALSSCKRVLNHQRCASNFQNQSPTATAEQISPSERDTNQRKPSIASKTSDPSNINKLIFSMSDKMTVFEGVVDRFKGVTVDSKKEIVEIADFPEKLQNSLEYWAQNGFRGIWFKIHTEHAQAVSELAKNGFDFHHAKSGYVMMFKWLPQNETVNIPHCAHTLLGVGGLVINDRNEVLAVSDRFALIPNSWKLPGGYVEPKEDLVDAAIREVREETGVETVFDTMVALRHSHGGTFDCSDMYFVIGLKPLTDKLTACEREISRVQWMPVDEYLSDPNVHETNRHFVRTYLQYKKEGIKLNCTTATHQILKRQYNLYSLEKET